ncbi:hypothetical protein VRRI112168_00310 [Vreelandella rituensis]|uniref:Uncharacterized protein n=1 Tax=Vreelandella rituensis TaxID=2282306 RepID=A0A368U9G0_9GAMM|nr:hypothetical protein [Halomonas rituensis]RCV93859.1 hypothetical protein DU506_01495 [Halomonas rituensis]
MLNATTPSVNRDIKLGAVLHHCPGLSHKFAMLVVREVEAYGEQHRYSRSRPLPQETSRAIIANALALQAEDGKRHTLEGIPGLVLETRIAWGIDIPLRGAVVIPSSGEPISAETVERCVQAIITPLEKSVRPKASALSKALNGKHSPLPALLSQLPKGTMVCLRLIPLTDTLQAAA